MSYKWIRTNQLVQRLADNAQIPVDDGNFDWKKVLLWIAEGNTIAPADPAPDPIDFSDSDNAEKAIKAVLLCVAQVGGLSPAQIRTMFKNKYDSLP